MTEELHDYMVAHGMPLDPIATELVAETQTLGSAAVMLTTADQAALLTTLTRLISARRAVEIGTFTGFSALAISRGLPDDGQLICLDASAEWTAVGRKYWERAGVAGKIELRIGDGHELAAALDGTFDLAFVDADKPGYIDYFERLVQLVRPNGLMLFDNTLAGGRVVDADGPLDRKEFNAHVAADDRVDVVMLGIGDGLTLVRKK
ncbi:O-methyltransferase [Kribbella solani]|uniref:Caffeoyl-CoA O-methyltransferase n=1 Tax=Kribbella solani TaxID=236067 RepID=A0A841DJH2_9ACTN|nr:class I SAM-dependent methyltransferase [Kribbella solani]MBB5979294.1 caffeoyl-CoA O-methyltransferase [Kribbella solani]MDX2970724.1 class I SAM-dependent methyltransferase [Kribbella solani]MDX3003390.1 class I SAM-dependent methyltransferase [Kribbella solani]